MQTFYCTRSKSPAKWTLGMIKIASSLTTKVFVDMVGIFCKPALRIVLAMFKILVD